MPHRHNVLAGALLAAAYACTPATMTTPDWTVPWLVQVGGGGPELVYDITATPDGRVCATGSFWATVTFGEGNRTKTMSTDGTQDLYVACYDRDGTLRSATQFGTHRGDEVRAIAALPNGDVVITGYFSRRFGADAASALEADSSADIFLARIDANGEQVWAKRFGADDADSGAALATTRDGDILLAGNFTRTMLFPLGDKVSKLNSAGSADAFVMKLTGDGDVVWARQLEGSGYDQATAVAEAPDGQIVVAGFFADEVALGGKRVRSSGYNDVFVASLSSNGNPAWLRALGGDRQDTLNGLGVDERGRIHLTGSFQGTMSLDAVALESAGSADVYIARLSRSGSVDHAYSFGSVHTEQVFDLARSDDGTIVYVGHYQGTTDFAPGERVEMRDSARPGDSNAFILTLDEEAGFRDVRTIGGIGVEMGFAVATLHNGHAAVAGVFNQAFDPRIAGLGSLSNRGKSDVFVLLAAVQ